MGKNNQPKEVKQKEEAVSSTVKIQALRNTFLPDGTFVKEGDVVVVDRAYAEATATAKVPHFIIL